MTAGCRQSHLRGRNRCSGGKQLISLACLCALGHDVFAHGEGALLRQLHMSGGYFHMLQHRHGIGARRNRSAGHDLPGRAWRQFSRGCFACARGAGNGERHMRGRFLGAAGKAVAGRAGKGRLIAICAQRPRKDPARRPAKLHALRRQAGTRPSWPAYAATCAAASS